MSNIQEREHPATMRVSCTVLLATIALFTVTERAFAEQIGPFSGVSPAAFDNCLKPKEQNRTTLGYAEYSGGDSGTVEFKDLIGTTWTWLEYNYSRDQKRLTYEITHSNAPIGRVKGDTEYAVNECKKKHP